MKRHLPVLLALFIVSTLPLRQALPAPSPLPGAAMAAGGAGNRPPRFSDRDRRAAHDYAEHHGNDPEFRGRDRLPPPFEARITDGYVMDKDMRKLCHPAPAALVRGLARCPHGYRYVIIGGYLCLVDNHDRIDDTMNLQTGP